MERLCEAVIRNSLSNVRTPSAPPWSTNVYHTSLPRATATGASSTSVEKRSDSSERLVSAMTMD